MSHYIDKFTPLYPHNAPLMKGGHRNKILQKNDFSRSYSQFKNIPTLILTLVVWAGVCLHSSLVGSIFEMSLAIPKPIFNKKFP